MASYELPIGLGYLVGYTLGRYISPDWDIMGTTGDEGRMVNEIPILGHFIYGVSSAYGSWHRKKHRSWQTHSPYISTAGRLIWLLWLPYVVLDYYGILPDGLFWRYLWLGVWLGLSLADGIHVWLDKHYGGD